MLTPEEQELRQDAIRLTRRNDTILNVITRLEEALEESEKLKENVAWLERCVSDLEREMEGDV